MRGTCDADSEKARGSLHCIRLALQCLVWPPGERRTGHGFLWEPLSSPKGLRGIL